MADKETEKKFAIFFSDNLAQFLSYWNSYNSVLTTFFQYFSDPWKFLVAYKELAIFSWNFLLTKFAQFMSYWNSYNSILTIFLFYFTDPWKYLVADKEAEKKWGFSLSTSLVTASKSKLLDGYKVFATSSVLPCPKELKGIYFLFFIYFFA